MNRIGLLLAVCLAGCATDAGDAQDGADDSFLGDGKADAFGVEDWSPDGAAVLRLVTSASQDALDNEVGLSSYVAKNIVAARATLPGKKFDDLAQLDAVKYVGPTAFHTLLRYVNEHHMFMTSLRVPLLLEDENTQDLKPISTFNEQAKAAGVSGFASYTFVNEKTDFSAKMDSYNTRLNDLAMKANFTLGGEMLIYAYNYDQFEAGSSKICYIGDGDKVIDVMQGQAGTMVGEMYTVAGWRHGDTKWTYDDDTEDSLKSDYDDWNTYDTKSDDVMVVYTNDDDGTNLSTDVISRCR